MPPRRGRAAVPARPGRRRRRPRRAGRPAAAGARARRRARRLPARARLARGPAAAGPHRPLGRRLLPGRGVAPVDDPPGGLAVTVRTADLAWARRLVASLGGAALVDEPAELAAQVAADARAALARYGVEAPAQPPARVGSCCCSGSGSPSCVLAVVVLGGAGLRPARRVRPAQPGGRRPPSATSDRLLAEVQATPPAPRRPQPAGRTTAEPPTAGGGRPGSARRLAA